MKVATAENREHLSHVLEGLQLGRPQTVGGLTLIPLCRASPDLDAVLLTEALRTGESEVSEVSAEGDVNRVLVRHRGNRPLLIMSGEEIVGAKQNRMFNASFIVAPGVDAKLPVSCVERGRWKELPTPAPSRSSTPPRRAALPPRPRGRTFTSPGRTITAELRARSLRRVTDSIITGIGYDADQGAVWRDVGSHLAANKIASRTGAYADAANAVAAEVERARRAVEPVADQLGVAAVRGGRLVALELLGSASLFGRAWPVIARGLLSDTGAPFDGWQAADVVVRTALHAVATGTWKRQPAPGGGETLHLSCEKHVFGAVAFGASLYHCMGSAR